jgi:hypothetical protein
MQQKFFLLLILKLDYLFIVWVNCQVNIEMNSISVKTGNIPLMNRIQLNQYIQRICGPKIGFHCWTITAITKSNIIQVKYFQKKISNFYTLINSDFNHNLFFPSNNFTN